MKQEWAVVSIREKRKEHYVTLSDGNTNGHADMGDPATTTTTTETPEKHNSNWLRLGGFRECRWGRV